jgi:tyrosine-protein kinase Etk/Wzc
MAGNIDPYQLEDKMNPRVYIKMFLKAWKWYAISFIFALLIGVAFLRYSMPIYTSEATMLIIEDDENILIVKEGATGRDKFSLARKTQAEAVILKSRFLLERVVKKRNLNIQIFSLTGFTELKTTEAYKDPAFMVYEINGIDSLLYKEKLEFIIQPLTPTTFKLTTGKNDSDTFGLNDSFTIGNVSLKLNTSTNYKEHWVNYKYKVIITPIDQVVTALQKQISINDEKAEIGVLKISLNGPTPEKNDNIIDGLIDGYLSNSIFEKNKVARTTKDFITERIYLIEKELSMIESNGVTLKNQNDVLDINIEYSNILLNQNELDKQIINTKVQLTVVKYVQDYINEDGNMLVPVNLGLESTPLVKAITAYNTLFIDYTQLKEGTGDKNPKLQSIKSELTSSKINLQKSMKSLMLSQKIRLEELESQYTLGEGKIALLPKYERQQRNIDRHKQIIESLYLFLLQKKEENEIILASTIADGRVIDSAFSNPPPISPNNRIVYVLILVMSILPATLGLYLKAIFNNKVASNDEFNTYRIPLIGIIPDSNEKNTSYSKLKDNSISKSFRMLRVHLNLLFETKKSTCKTLLITSLNSKEGKTFTALNLGRSLADIDEKVLLIDIDLRDKGLVKQLKIDPKLKGVSDYVIDENLSLQDILIPSTSFDKLSFISSGTTLLNPSELLSKSRIKSLINEAKKQYDYVIIDAQSIDNSLDTYLLVKYVDITLLVCKLGRLMIKDLRTIRDHMNTRKLGSMHVIFNQYKKNINVGRSVFREANYQAYLRLLNRLKKIIKRN